MERGRAQGQLGQVRSISKDVGIKSKVLFIKYIFAELLSCAEFCAWPWGMCREWRRWRYSSMEQKTSPSSFGVFSED